LATFAQAAILFNHTDNPMLAVGTAFCHQPKLVVEPPAGIGIQIGKLDHTVGAQSRTKQISPLQL
jgi:hypothetical protein